MATFTPFNGSTLGPVTISPPATPTTVDGLDVKDTGTGRTTGQLVQVFDHNGSPIWSIPPAGGPRVYGDYSSAGAGVFGPFTGLDGVNQAVAFDITAVNHATSRIFMTSGAPAAGIGNNGDFAFRIDTPGTANQRIYVKSAGAWSALAV